MNFNTLECFKRSFSWAVHSVALLRLGVCISSCNCFIPARTLFLQLAAPLIQGNVRVWRRERERWRGSHRSRLRHPRVGSCASPPRGAPAGCFFNKGRGKNKLKLRQKWTAGIIRALGALIGLNEPAQPPMGASTHPPCPGPSSPSSAQLGAVVPAGAMLSACLIPAKWWTGLRRWVSGSCCRCPPSCPAPPGGPWPCPAAALGLLVVPLPAPASAGGSPASAGRCLAKLVSSPRVTSLLQRVTWKPLPGR